MSRRFSHPRIRLSARRRRFGVPAAVWFLLALVVASYTPRVRSGQRGGLGGGSGERFVIERTDGTLIVREASGSSITDLLTADPSLKDRFEGELSSIKTLYAVTYDAGFAYGGDHPRYGSSFVDPRTNAFLTISVHQRILPSGARSEVDSATSERVSSFVLTQITTQTGGLFRNAVLKPGINLDNGPWARGEEHNRRVVFRAVMIPLAGVCGVIGLWAFFVTRRNEFRRQYLEALLCPRCVYAIDGINSSKCPECGESLGMT